MSEKPYIYWVNIKQGGEDKVWLDGRGSQNAGEVAHVRGTLTEHFNSNSVSSYWCNEHRWLINMRDMFKLSWQMHIFTGVTCKLFNIAFISLVPILYLHKQRQRKTMREGRLFDSTWQHNVKQRVHPSKRGEERRGLLVLRGWSALHKPVRVTALHLNVDMCRKTVLLIFRAYIKLCSKLFCPPSPCMYWN